jgi:hypothetical protein
MYGAPYDLLAAALGVRADRLRGIVARWRRAGLAATGSPNRTYFLIEWCAEVYVMSPRSRGRPPGRGRRRQPIGHPAARQSRRTEPGPRVGKSPDCWFDEPDPADCMSWAAPAGHGSYEGMNLELLDPEVEDELMFLIEAQHPEFAAALHGHGDVMVGGEPVNPRLHIAMHHIVARQLMGNDPPEVWRTVQRLAELGYDWHTVMHMIAGLVAADVHGEMTGQSRFDPADYARRLDELPGDWPPPINSG